MVANNDWGDVTIQVLNRMDLRDFPFDSDIVDVVFDFQVAEVLFWLGQVETGKRRVEKERKRQKR